MSRQRKAKGRPVNGVLLLDKPLGITSNAALQKAKRLLGAAKAGHTGSLDPMATGVLPLCFGEATKFSQYLLDADKAYTCTIRFGIRTTTADAEGAILTDQPIPLLTQAAVETVLATFLGEIAQVPPMFSALKHQGVPLYKLAREGVEIERAPRQVTIYQIALSAFRAGEYPEADIAVKVSKGTYIRTLAADIGDQLGCGAHVTRLRRTQAGSFAEQACVTLEHLEVLAEEDGVGALDELLLPATTLLAQMPEVTLPSASGFYFRQGQPVLEVGVLRTVAAGEIVRVMLDNGEFIGVAEVRADGYIAPKRLLQQMS
ncbi:MAG: tRNA pseudouridine(55) synthase TruB [Pseudomonadales bacterium]|nr:tRNA pseudouridine(55) synthase TruB [Pseudomonadales bacterium]